MNKQLLTELKTYIEPEKAAFFPTFFKAIPGGYGEGDKFWGIRVPPLRKLAKKYKQLDCPELTALITSEIHEQRLLALFVLRQQFELAQKKGEIKQQQDIIDFYLENLAGVNNWDLVDSSEHYLLGNWLLDKDCDILWQLANSESLWSQRIAIMSSLAFIIDGRYELTLTLTLSLALAEHLLQHPHDLMHKAVGWMLREVGNRDLQTELIFLDKHYQVMPRTMLRYAIEKFDEPLRLSYLKGIK